MCDTCGCQDHAVPVDGHEHHHDHNPEDSARSRVEMEVDVLSVNNRFAAANRERLSDVAALNLISSPGSGKTTLLERTLTDLRDRFPLAVLEGDLQTDNDAKRIQATGVPAHQLITGGSCHLDAHAVGHGMDHLPLPRRGILFIENVGNLVCPTSFDLGEDHKIVLLSVTEGDDKPAKYPPAFAGASAMVLTKIDLLPHVDFDTDRAEELARAVNPEIKVFRLSARTGEGMERWYEWLAGMVPAA